jgi:pantoate--beta-alanine ligase
VAIQVLKTICEMQKASNNLRYEGRRIAVVPTMGYLHRGHTSLIEQARTLADVVVTTIFVNPTQFAPNEDFNRYPRDFQRDQALAAQAGTDILFYPETSDMYPQEFATYIEVEGVSKILEGKFRPSHFRGVTTVVVKLFNIIKPHVAIFGQKDIQQAFVIQKMVRELNYDISIIVAPIVREADGLAMSSRNTYLNKTERKNATVLFRSLQHANERIKVSERNVTTLRREIEGIIQSGDPTQIDYIAFIDPATFTEVERIESPEVIVALAVRFGTTRLIDNIRIQLT